MKRVRYELCIRKGNTLRIERVKASKSEEECGYQKLAVIEEGEE